MQTQASELRLWAATVRTLSISPHRRARWQPTSSLTKTRREAESTHADQQVVINALENDLKVERAKLLEERKSAERLKWGDDRRGVLSRLVLLAQL